MYPESWKAVNRLLLLYAGDRDAATDLHPAIRLLHHALPAVKISFLSFHSDPAFTLALPWLEILSLDALGINTQTNNLTSSSISDIELPLIQAVCDRAFDAAIIFTTPSQSPYALAYLCYLAEISIRLGQSHEFGGGVLSACITPPVEDVSLTDYYLHLLLSAGFSVAEHKNLIIA